MNTSCFMNFELSSIMRECKYYSILSLCEVLHGNATSNMDKIEKYLLEEQNSFFLGSDFEYFSKLAKSASIVVSSEDDGNHLWISTEVLLHIITAVKKGERGRKEYLLTGKKAIELRNAIFECIVGLEESAGNHMKKYIQNSILLSFSLASQQAKKKSQLHKPQVGVPVKEEEEEMKEKPAERSHHMPKPEVHLATKFVKSKKAWLKIACLPYMNRFRASDSEPNFAKNFQVKRIFIYFNHF